MLVTEKYRLQREIGWSDEAEVHCGPPHAEHRVPVAVKIRHGLGGPPRPDGNRERFLRAAADQKAAAAGGCKQIAPIFDAGHEGDNAFYVTRHYQRSLDSLIQGRVTLEALALHRITSGVLQALEELRDRRSRSHGNLKPTNIFLEGKSVPSSTVILSDLARPDAAGSQGDDCFALGAVLFQLVRARPLRNFLRDFVWPIEPDADWERLGPQGHAWREFCNVLMAPGLPAQPDALATARQTFKNMRRLNAAARSTAHAAATREGESRPVRKGLIAGIAGAATAAAAAAALLLHPADSRLGRQLRSVPVLMTMFRLIDVPKPSMTRPETPKPAVNPVSNPPMESRRIGSAPPVPPPARETLSATPAPTPAMAAAATPVPAPDPVQDDSILKWVYYSERLKRFQDNLNDQTKADALDGELTQLKANLNNNPIGAEPSVAEFIRRLPPKLEPTGDQPDLPPGLWSKSGSTKDPATGVQSFTYAWAQRGPSMTFNRVADASGNAPAFYLSATTVPVNFAAVLAERAKSDGGGAFFPPAPSGGPVAWQVDRAGGISLRGNWVNIADHFNQDLYAQTGQPSWDSPMNGLSGVQAMRLARAAGCSLPTLAQWQAVLASPAGKYWVENWPKIAKVRGPSWEGFVKKINSDTTRTGTSLPNGQCFGSENKIYNRVTDAADNSLFFEPAAARFHSGFSHLIGNVGQYVVSDGRDYYFAGGSAESDKSVFEAPNFASKVSNEKRAIADAGLRLAILAKGDGSGKNPALDDLKKNLAAEITRAENQHR